MRIENVRILDVNGEVANGSIGVQDGRFSDANKADSEVLDGEGLLMVPGAIDTHLHGCHKDDFSDGSIEALETMLRFEISVGVTSIFPTSMTIEENKLLNVMKIVGEYQNDSKNDLATFQGVNMEGPFINPDKKGAQDATYIKKCDVEFFHECQEAAGGNIKVVDIAPEMKNGMEFIDEIHRECRISIAHTLADYETAKEAYGRGACRATHLYNAMPPFSHRAPGVIGAAYDNKDVYVELVCDGIHSHPSVVRATFDMFGKERIVLISDSMRATGLGEGISSLGGQEVNVVGRKAMLTSDGAIAGSVTHLMDCVRVAICEMGIPLGDAFSSATIVPARSMGIDKDYGSIEVGKIADFLLLDDELNLKAVYKHGRKVS